MQTDNQTQELTKKEQQALTGGNRVIEAVKALAAAVADALSYKGPQV